MELPVASKTPVMLVNPNPKMSPRVDITKTPAKLMNVAKMSLGLIFCRSKGIDNKTSVIGQIKLSGWASCAGSNEYALKRTA